MGNTISDRKLKYFPAYCNWSGCILPHGGRQMGYMATEWPCGMRMLGTRKLSSAQNVWEHARCYSLHPWARIRNQFQHWRPFWFEVVGCASQFVNGYEPWQKQHAHLYTRELVIDINLVKWSWTNETLFCKKTKYNEHEIKLRPWKKHTTTKEWLKATKNNHGKSK